MCVCVSCETRGARHASPLDGSYMLLGIALQGYLTHKKHPPPRTLQ